MWGPGGFGDMGRRDIFFRELGSTINYFQGFGEQAHSFGDLGSPAKKVKHEFKNFTLKEKPSFRLIFLNSFSASAGSFQTPLHNLNVFTFVQHAKNSK